MLSRDYNVMPTDLDVYAPERWVDDALFRSEVRDAYRRLVAQGWTDALRHLHPDKRSILEIFPQRFHRDAGLPASTTCCSALAPWRSASPPLAWTAECGREHASDPPFGVDLPEPAKASMGRGQHLRRESLP